MNLKNMSVIFVIILLPIILIYALYSRMQIDALNAQTLYDTKLSASTYDAMKAFNTNSLSNPRANVSDSLIRDINASISTFMSTLSMGFGNSGQDVNYIRPYIPALVYILYDGYYIYSPTTNIGTGNYEHMLKPYIYYTAKYVNSSIGVDVVINYTLDNYISYYGYIDGVYKTGAGYLEDSVNASSNTYKGITITDSDAREYYKNASKFTETVYKDLGELKESDIKEIGQSTNVPEEFKNRDKEFLTVNSDYEPRVGEIDFGYYNDEESNFNHHRKEVIKVSIQNNLNAAMASYTQYAAKNYTFRMPKISETEWNEILKDISVVSFMQGIPIGMKIYNGYSYTTNTVNKHTISEAAIYFIDDSNIYHKIDCPKVDVNDGNIKKGHQSYLFEKILDETKNPAEWAYREGFEDKLACYECIINGNYVKIITDERRQIMYNAIGKEKHEQYNKADELN